MGQKVRRSQVAVVKNPPANAGDARVRCLGWEDPLVNGMAIHSSILAWRVPWTEGAWYRVAKGLTQLQVYMCLKPDS